MCIRDSLYRKRILDEIGLFDENFFAYYEDVDISWRANSLGYKNVYCPAAKCYHICGATTGAVRYNPFKSIQSGRNSILLPVKNMPLVILVLNLPFFQLVMYSAVVMILWFGGQLILAGEMQVGELTGFLSYVLQVMNSLMMISNVFLLLTRSLTSAHRIGQVLEEAPDLEEPEDPAQEVPDGSIDFDCCLLYTSFSGKPPRIPAPSTSPWPTPPATTPRRCCSIWPGGPACGGLSLIHI